MPIQGWIDSGADDTLLPDWVASAIGVPSAGAPSGTVRTATIATASVWYAEVTLRLADNQEQRAWSAWVGFVNAPLRHAYLGIASFLEYFDTKLYGAQEMIEIEINANYQGT